MVPPCNDLWTLSHAFLKPIKYAIRFTSMSAVFCKIFVGVKCKYLVLTRKTMLVIWWLLFIVHLRHTKQMLANAFPDADNSIIHLQFLQFADSPFVAAILWCNFCSHSILLNFPTLVSWFGHASYEYFLPIWVTMPPVPQALQSFGILFAALLMQFLQANHLQTQIANAGRSAPIDGFRGGHMPSYTPTHFVVLNSHHTQELKSYKAEIKKRM